MSMNGRIKVRIRFLNSKIDIQCPFFMIIIVIGNLELCAVVDTLKNQEGGRDKASAILGMFGV